MSEFKIHGLSAEGEAYRAALVAIQELHGSAAGFYCDHCSVPSFGYEAPHDVEYPCPTRRLADGALGGGQDG